MAAATMTTENPSIVIRFEDAEIGGTYTATATKAGENLVIERINPTVISSIISRNIKIIAPRFSIHVNQSKDRSKEIARIIKDGKYLVGTVVNCIGSKSEEKHDCKTSVFDFVMWGYAVGIRIFGETKLEKLYDEEADSAEADELLASKRAELYNLPKMYKPNTGGRKTHKKRLHSRRTHRSRRTRHRTHHSRHHSTRRHRRTQRKH